MADKNKTKIQAADSAANGGDAEPSLGHLITEARERKGMTRDQVATEAHLPAHYVKMIETDSYDMISDRLYLVPFLRRYATFLGLDAEEIASRFVSNVQHAEANVVRISQEITMVEKKPGSAGRIAFAVMIVARASLEGAADELKVVAVVHSGDDARHAKELVAEEIANAVLH